MDGAAQNGWSMKIPSFERDDEHRASPMTKRKATNWRYQTFRGYTSKKWGGLLNKPPPFFGGINLVGGLNPSEKY